MQGLDQFWVNSKHQIVGWLPEPFQPIVSILLSILPLLVVFPTLFALTTILERKGLGRIQNRRGPNRVGPFGLLQPAADGIKMLTKEDIVPRAADRVVHFLAPIALLIPVFLALSVLPYGRNMLPNDIDGGLLFFFAVGSAQELSVFMAGWSSRNKYSLLGGMRAIAQMISYEIPFVLSAMVVVMMSGSLSLDVVVEKQGSLSAWNVWTPWGLAGTILFFIAASAESNRTPFDIPEAESEIIAGYLVEYSGFKYALFFLGEYLGLFAVSGLWITLFFGGWQAPLEFLTFIPSWAWFFLKLFGVICLFIWVRGTLPRLRMDQLMNFAWKFMLPMTLLNLAVAGIWHFLREDGISWPVSWLICGGILLAAHLMLSRGFHTTINKRVYRYAS